MAERQPGAGRARLDVREFLGLDEGPEPIEPRDRWHDFDRVYGNYDSPAALLAENSERFLDPEIRPPAEWNFDARWLVADLISQRSDLVTRLYRRVDGLNEPYRTIVINRYWYAFREREIGQALNISTPTVSFLIEAALGQLADVFDSSARSHEGD